MALFDKLFSSKRKLEYVGSRDFSSQEITLEQVRLLLFKECDWKGRKLLFDSSTIQRVALGKNGKLPSSKDLPEGTTIIEVTEGFAYLYKGPAQDASSLGEMIFGAVAMNYKGVSLKIHIMDEPQRLMCTKVFCVPAARKTSKMERKVSTNECQDRPRSGTELPISTKPLSVPSLNTDNDLGLNLSFDRKDSGFYGDISAQSSVSSNFDLLSMLGIMDGNSQEDFFSFNSPPGRKLSVSSNGSWQRRTFRSIATRFSLGQSGQMLTVPSSMTNNDSQIYSNSSTSGTTDSLSSSVSCSSLRKNKLGLALLITITDAAQLDTMQRIVGHSPQLQALVCRLRVATVEAGAGTSGFVATLYQAALAAARWLSDILYGPRIQPIWLTLVTSSPTDAHKMADSIVTDLCSVLNVADTKHTNFFISTLLTHVLTYHLGWVTSVSPYEMPKESQIPKSDINRPYNALWAQLTDLCGNIGFPPKTAKTIIYGKTDINFINKLLVVLTYFIRCGEVKHSNYNFKYNSKEDNLVFVDLNNKPTNSLKRTKTHCNISVENATNFNTFSSGSTLCESPKSLSNSVLNDQDCLVIEKPITSQIKKTSTVISIKAENSSVEDGTAQNVVFVLGDNEKLVGLKNKSNGGKSVKKSRIKEEKTEDCKSRHESPSKCCGQQLKHSKPLKHSGFKFEFDKYPQIATNYMKSKNLEILDRHYLGKPGNLKLDNFQFDPMVVPPLQEEKCEVCVKCQLMESNLQTPTNASELEYTNDQVEHQFANVIDCEKSENLEPKTFVRKRKENTVVVNVNRPCVDSLNSANVCVGVEVKKVLQLPLPDLVEVESSCKNVGFDSSLLGAVNSHYVPDFVLQGTIAEPKEWEKELKRDLDITSYLNKNLDLPVQSVAIVGDTSKWEVCVRGGTVVGMSALVGGMLDALPHMRDACLPATQCLYFIESKLREFCVLSKTLADILMSSELCDMSSLTRAMNIHSNDVPLLLAVAATHTPQVAARYGVGYR